MTFKLPAIAHSPLMTVTPGSARAPVVPVATPHSPVLQASRSAADIFDAVPLPAAGSTTPKLSLLAPGTAQPSFKPGLPKFDWPKTADEAVTGLVEQGFHRTAGENGSVVLTRNRRQVTIVPMAIADTPGYTATSPAERHVQLGDLTFSGKLWAAFAEGFEAPLRNYNRALERENIYRRSPLPRDASELHGPQDGLKHYLRLAKRGEGLTKKRVKAQELAQARAHAMQAIDIARKAGTLPKHVVVVVEGLDGASKTGNGLTMSRLLEDAGFEVKAKAFRAPTQEERALGPLGRYEQFVDVANATKPTAWFLDRGYPGDYVHNPDASLAEITAAADAFEKRMRDQGVLVIKMLYAPSKKASMETFGKRFARAAIARDLLARRRDLSGDEIASLEAAAALLPGLNDFRSVANAEQTQARYDEFSKISRSSFPWSTVETANRHQGRLESLKIFAHAISWQKAPWATKAK